MYGQRTSREGRGASIISLDNAASLRASALLCVWIFILCYGPPYRWYLEDENGQHEMPLRGAGVAICAVRASDEVDRKYAQGGPSLFCSSGSGCFEERGAIRHENSLAVYKLRDDAPCTSLAYPYPWPCQVLP